MKYLWVALAVVCYMLFMAWVLKPFKATYAKPAAPGVVPASSIFHKPTKADCPIGTGLLRGYFLENDGTRLDACHNPKGDGSTDYLNPGEGFAIGFDWKTDVQMDSSGKKI